MPLIPFRHHQHTELEMDKVSLRSGSSVWVKKSILELHGIKFDPQYAQLYISKKELSVGIRYRESFDPAIIGLVKCRVQGRGFRTQILPLIRQLELCAPERTIKLDYIYKDGMIVVDLSELAYDGTAYWENK